LTSVDFERALRATLQHESNCVYVALRVLIAFENKHGRTPQTPITDQDLSELISLNNQLLDPLKNRANRKSIVNRATDQFMTQFGRNLGTEISPVCAVLGGISAQEIVKIIFRNDVPFLNFFFFNGLDDDNSGNVECIFPAT